MKTVVLALALAPIAVYPMTSMRKHIESKVRLNVSSPADFDLSSSPSPSVVLAASGARSGDRSEQDSGLNASTVDFCLRLRK